MSQLLANFLTESEAAIELRRSVRTLESWRARRIGPPFLKIGGQGQVLYRRESILRWLEQQEVQPVRARKSTRLVSGSRP